jgi:predicted nucleic acid-binding protein
MLFIYWMEGHPQFSQRIDSIWSRMKERDDQLLTGSFTFGEILAGFYRRGAAAEASEARKRIEGIVSEILPFTTDTADHYGRIRAATGLAAADAIHLASAAQAETDLFLTNDKRLVGKFVPGIQFIASIEDDVL